MIKCGNCKRDHETVHAVRVCYGVDRSLQAGSYLPRAITPTPAAYTLSRAIAKGLGHHPASAPTASATAGATGNLPDVPAGRYAVQHEGVLKFYRVDRPTEGKWSGFTFVKVQASDELHRIRGGTAKAVLMLIAEDPRAASLRYGQELGECGVCGRTLTDETSRANGIGPICAGKSGW